MHSWYIIFLLVIYTFSLPISIFTHHPHHLLVASPASHDNVADYTTQIASIVQANWNASSPGVARICSICEVRFGMSPLFPSERKCSVMWPQRFTRRVWNDASLLRCDSATTLQGVKKCKLAQNKRILHVRIKLFSQFTQPPVSLNL